MKLFENKVALVTGGSRGIGKATVIELARKGCNVIINYNKEKELTEELKAFVERESRIKAIAIKADISNEQEVKSLVEESIKAFGKIDILINNAGIVIDKEFEDRTVEDFKKTYDVNVIGTFLVSKYVSEYMLKNKYGKIVNISSTNGIDHYFPSSIDYDASKAAIISLTHNMALQFAPYINVNAVAPGWVDTDMNKDLPEEMLKEESEKIFVKRLADPQEIAKVIVFLASDDASYVNNAVIMVDGGTY